LEKRVCGATSARRSESSSTGAANALADRSCSGAGSHEGLARAGAESCATGGSHQRASHDATLHGVAHRISLRSDDVLCGAKSGTAAGADRSAGPHAGPENLVHGLAGCEAEPRSGRLRRLPGKLTPPPIGHRDLLLEVRFPSHALLAKEGLEVVHGHAGNGVRQLLGGSHGDLTESLGEHHLWREGHLLSYLIF
jgi:hypothetical protein